MSKGWMRSTVASLALVALATAPARSAAQTQVEADRSAREDEAPVLRVVNNNWLDMHIYASRATGPLQSLGVVGTFDTAVFRLPVSAIDAAAGLRIVADPIGGFDAYVSPDILTSAGSEVVVTLENSLPLSFASVRPRQKTG
jgi:hypothetical protein